MSSQMPDGKTEKLCMELLRSDSELDVIEVLTRAGYWDAPSVWRLFGDNENNYATIGNQQSRPEASLVEKLINSVDARLMNECLTRGIDPTSAQAPSSIREAVSLFFEDKKLEGEVGGTLQGWSQGRQREESKFITLAATGTRQNPSLVIVDCGEGQTGSQMPYTFLSINRANKLRIPFVQGKFNMGGTGALRACGKEHLQLVITRRNPEIVNQDKDTDPSAPYWSFTIVRRERPDGGTGGMRNSVYRYLAPCGADTNPQRGEVLTFSASSLPLLPERNDAYAKPITYGSCIKLYEYDMKGFKSHVLMKGGLLSRLELFLPEIALPVRVHECRDFRGHEGSFENTLVGLAARLAENRAGNMEEGFPTPAMLCVHGYELKASIYAFKSDRAESYRTTEGIIFTINGQTHGSIAKTFFSRSTVKMGRLAKSLIVIVDCSKLPGAAREDLFMNSRDRLSSGELRKSIDESLEDLVSKHPGLRELQERRRREEIAERLDDSKPLEDVLESVLKNSPSLEKLFLLGQRLSRPHPTRSASARGDGQQGNENGAGAFLGRVHPTYFRFYGLRDGEGLARDAQIGRRCRIKFETDVSNDYFCRDSNPGHYHVEAHGSNGSNREVDSVLTLHNGIANWSLSIPDEELEINDTLTVRCTVRDDIIDEPFTNTATLSIKPMAATNGQGVRRPEKHGRGNPGSSGHGGASGPRGANLPPEPAGLQMPKITKVRQPEWEAHEFDERSACTILEESSDDSDGAESIYTFYVNVDNIYLRTDMKVSKDDVALHEAKFVYGNVLIGLALIHQYNNERRTNSSDGPDAEEPTPVSIFVERTTRAIAPFLVPMIDALGALSPDDVSGLAGAGDEE